MIDPNINNDVSRLRRGERVDSTGRVRRDMNAPPFRPVLDDSKDSHKERTVKEKPDQPTTPSIFDISRQKTRAPSTLKKPATTLSKEGILQEESLALARETRANKKPTIETAHEEPDLPPVIEKEEDSTDVATAQQLAGLQEGSKQAALNAQVAGREHHDEGGSSREDRSKSSTVEPVVGADVAVPRTDFVAPTSGALAAAMIEPLGSRELAVAPTKSLQEVINTVVESLALLKAGDQTDTAVLLRNPPILAGAQLVLSSFEGANGQFNVAFYNLTQAGQQFLDQMQARSGIQKALTLANEDYIMHMFITTTQAYEPIVPVDAENLADARRFSRDERQGQEKDKEQNG